MTSATKTPGGYGKAFGSAVHGLFAYALRQRNSIGDSGLPRAVVEAALDEYDAGDDVETAARMLRAFLSGPVWTAVRTADVVHVELPVSRLQSDNGIPNLTSGAIDLLYRTDTGWHLVDHKTDRVTDDGSSLLEAYRPQLEAYADMWKAASGEPVVQSSLWLADAGRLASLEE